MRKFLPVFFSTFLLLTTARASRIVGLVTDQSGQPLSFASIMVKGTTTGTTSNNEGRYFLQLDPGTYTIVAQYVGYGRQEQTITLGKNDITLDFRLAVQELTLAEVVVRPGAEDPAYEIIRNAIKKRPYYQDELDRFQCEVYIKGQLKLRDFPDKFLGREVDFEDGDTSKRKMIYLSETLARYSVDKPNKRKIDVLSTRVSGSSDGYGLSAPQILSFYDNNIQIGSNLNPRGFISPIANGALNYYRYRFEGNFMDGGVEVNRIKVIPKRRFEPLFSGYINIVEGSWRIHSLQLELTKESQMQIVDTLKIEQLYTPFQENIWVMKTQVMYPSIKIFGFDIHGSFVNVYSGFNIEPDFSGRFFNNTLLKFYEGSNKKPAEYWDSIRPVPLQLDELEDYRKKDSLEQVRNDPHYLDSIDRRRNKLRPVGLILTGQSFGREKNRERFSINPLIQSVNFNTVEGWVANISGTYSKRLDSTFNRRAIFFTPVIRYGFSNHHFNASGMLRYNYGKKYFNSVSIAGGKQVFQLNNANPISAFSNTFRTLLYEHNYAKYYEAWFASVDYVKGIGNGLSVFGSLHYQDRLPLENTTDYTMHNRENVSFDPNYPTDLMGRNFERHQAFIGTIGVSWRPGTRYIEYPDRKVSIGSRYPTFSLSYTQGFHDILDSDIDYSKWRFGINDNLNLKLLGRVSYNISTGGFLRHDSVAVQDYIHFNGNQVLAAANYLNSFQLLPYYKYSNTEQHYVEGHVEYHLNGLLTNKIPLFRRLNWHLVTGTNVFYLDKDRHYAELLVGLENIFRIARVDWVWGFESGESSSNGFRLGILLFQ